MEVDKPQTNLNMMTSIYANGIFLSVFIFECIYGTLQTVNNVFSLYVAWDKYHCKYAYIFSDWNIHE